MAYTAPGTALDVEITGERIEAVVTPEPLWDPKSERIKA
jgi:glycine cleavage system aminomethyltransferase T